MNDAVQKKYFFQSLRFESVYLKVICLFLLMQMLNWGAAYRTVVYLNLVIVTVYSYRLLRDTSDADIKKILLIISTIPAALLIINFLSNFELGLIKEIRHTIIAGGICLGIYLLSRYSTYVGKSIFLHLLAVFSLYLLIQLVALFIFDNPYGTTKNPHYLALYSSLGLIFFTSAFLKASLKLKIYLGAAVLLFGYILLQTGSRPAWLGVVAAVGVSVIFLQGAARKKITLYFSLILALLFLSNAGDFSEKVSNLILNVQKEERVTIWRDTWEMQKSSSPYQWVFGHGLDAFKSDFRDYSQYHLKNIDFNSPHNYFLEIIYISGIAGLITILLIYFYMIKKMIFGILLNNSISDVYLLLLLLFTCGLVQMSITIPFFSSFNLNLLAVTLGTIFFIEKAPTCK